MGNWALEVEEYHGRNPLQGFPSAIHYRLPSADYARAHILFALDPDRAKDKILTLTLGHYMGNGSGANMMVQTVVSVKDGKLPFGSREVGKIKRGNATLPVYYLPVDLNAGAVADIAARGWHFDFELMGKGWENLEQLDKTSKPDPNSDSAFNIFGITLEKAPVVIGFIQDQPANVFTADEKNRQTTVTLRAVADNAKGAVGWVAKDVRGRPVFSGEKAFSFGADVGEDWSAVHIEEDIRGFQVAVGDSGAVEGVDGRNK